MLVLGLYVRTSKITDLGARRGYQENEIRCLSTIKNQLRASGDQERERNIEMPIHRKSSFDKEMVWSEKAKVDRSMF